MEFDTEYQVLCGSENKKSLTFFSGSTGLHRTIWGNKRLYGTIQGYKGIYRSIRNHTGIYRGVRRTKEKVLIRQFQYNHWLNFKGRFVGPSLPYDWSPIEQLVSHQLVSQPNSNMAILAVSQPFQVNI